MSNPFIQIDDEIREMTDEEHEALLATGWTMEETNEALTANPEPLPSVE
jgi:hypothetical protein